MVYAGKCAGSREFKTFYFQQKDVQEACNQEASDGSPVRVPQQAECITHRSMVNRSVLMESPVARQEFEKEAKMECSNFNATLNARLNSPNKFSPSKQR